MKNHEKYKEIISNADDEFWQSLLSDSKEESENFWVNFEWYHDKHYENTSSQLNPHRKQVPILKEKVKEKPSDRELFYKSNGRFSLKGIEVAYFASDVALAGCEVSKNEITLQKKIESPTQMLQTVMLGMTPSMNKIASYPNNYKLRTDSLLVNLSHPNTTFNHFIKSELGCNSFFEDITLPNKNAYPLTQFVAKKIYNKKFDGIIFSSSQNPGSVTIAGWNLILFNRNAIISTSPYKEKK